MMCSKKFNLLWNVLNVLKRYALNLTPKPFNINIAFIIHPSLVKLISILTEMINTYFKLSTLQY